MRSFYTLCLGPLYGWILPLPEGRRPQPNATLSNPLFALASKPTLVPAVNLPPHASLSPLYTSQTSSGLLSHFQAVKLNKVPCYHVFGSLFDEVLCFSFQQVFDHHIQSNNGCQPDWYHKTYWVLTSSQGTLHYIFYIAYFVLDVQKSCAASH